MASNNIFSDVTRDIATSTGSYHAVLTGSDALPTPSLYLGDVFLLFMSLGLLLLAVREHSKKSSTPVSSN